MSLNIKPSPFPTLLSDHSAETILFPSKSIFFFYSVIFIGFFRTEKQFIALTYSGNTENIRSGKEFGEIKTRAAKEIFRK